MFMRLLHLLFTHMMFKISMSAYCKSYANFAEFAPLASVVFPMTNLIRPINFAYPKKSTNIFLQQLLIRGGYNT